MTSDHNIGRIIGILLIIQLVGGILVNFFLTAPLFGSPGFLVNGSLYAQQIGAAALINLIISSLSVTVAVMAFDIFSRHGKKLPLALLAIFSVGLAVTAFENIGLLSLVSFSDAYAQATTDTERSLFDSLKVIVTSFRNWAHYTNLILSGVGLLIFYLILFRSSLVPRALSSFGLLAVLLQISSVSLPFWGQSVIFPLLAPIGLSQLILSLWLMIKGFKQLDEQA